MVFGLGTEIERGATTGLKTPTRLQIMTTVIFACPKCGLAHQVTQVQVPAKKPGRFGCAGCGTTIHSWYGVFDYSGCKAVRMDRGRGNAALILQIRRQLRGREIQGDAV